MTLALWLVACAASAPAPATPPSAAPPGFWDRWGDGRAELSGYRLTTPRYGEPRTGEAVLIFVTETFTDAQRVKSDGGHDDEYPVVKLNDARRFDTGIYDYDAMTSVFVRLDGGLPLGLPTKVSLGVQEWCGNVYDQLLFFPDRYERVRHSYFDGEADLAASAAVAAGTLAADALPVLIRGLAGELLAPGARRDVTVLPTLLDARLRRHGLDAQAATLARSAATAPVTVPAGTYDAWTWTLTTPAGTTEWAVEAAAPHRIVRWTRSDGERAELTGSMRSKYWEQTRPGDEALRRELGL